MAATYGTNWTPIPPNALTACSSIELFPPGQFGIKSQNCREIAGFIIDVWSQHFSRHDSKLLRNGQFLPGLLFALTECQTE